MTATTVITALGWVGSGLVVLSLNQRDVRRLRQVNLVASLVLSVFNVVVGIPSMIALNVVLAAVNGHHLLADRRTARRRDERIDNDTRLYAAA